MINYNTIAQSSKGKNLFIEGGIRYGTALYHPKQAIFLKDLHYGGLEFRFGKQTTGKNYWENMLKYPSYGLVLRYSSCYNFFDSPSVRKERNKVLGQNIDLFAFFQGSIIRYKWFSWNYQFGLGVAYFTKTDNCLIQLPVSAYINLQMGFDFQVTDRLDLCINACLNHASNANMKLPNYGFNEIQGITGLRYHFMPRKEFVKTDTFPKYKPENSLFFNVEPGWLTARYDDNYYFKTGVNVGYVRSFFPIFKAGISFEFFYTRYLLHSKNYEKEEWEKPNSPRIPMPKNIFTSSIYGFGELVFGRCALHFGLDTYVYKGSGQAKKMGLGQNWDKSGTLKRYPAFYEKLGLRVYLGKNQYHFVGITLKVHAPISDYLAFAYGFNFYNFYDKKQK